MGVVPVHEQANDSNLSTGSGVVNRLMIGRVDCAYTRQVVDGFTVASNGSRKEKRTRESLKSL